MAFVPHFTEVPILEHVPVTKHKCEQPKEEDEIMAIRKGNRILDKLSRWFMRQRVLHKKHPLTRWCVKSTTAVNYEISRHLKSHPYMIHPFSSFRSWINSSYFQTKETIAKKYLVCLHRSLIAFSRSCHFLNMKTKEDIILNMILMIIGCFGAIFLLK